MAAEVQVVSIDAGNGGTNAAIQNEKSKGGYDVHYFPSMRARTSAESLGLGGLEMDYEWIEWQGTKYLLGDDVFVSRNGVERHIGKQRYGNSFHLFLIAAALGELLPGGGDVDLTLFAPPGMFREAKEAIEKAFENCGHVLSIGFKGEKKERSYRIRNLRIIPEGLGAMLVLILDEKGQKTNLEFLSGEHLILDSGMLTLDCLKVTDGQFNPEMLASASWEDQGVRAHILNPVLSVVRKQGGSDFDLIQAEDIDRALRKGIETGDYILESGAKKVNIKQAVDKYTKQYGDWLTNHIIDGQFQGLRGIKSMLSIGGGAIVTLGYMKKAPYASKLISLDQFKHTKDISPVDANAIGGLRLALGESYPAKKGKR